MNESIVSTECKVHHEEETPYVETRARVISSPDGALPEGKVLIMKTPILPPGATDEEIRASTTMEIVDDEHPDDPFYCEECDKIGFPPDGWLEHMDPWPRPKKKRPLRPGRNAPCPCGSGKKSKKCCLP